MTSRTCKHEKNLPNGSATICTLEHCNCIAVDSDLTQEECDCFEEAA